MIDASNGAGTILADAPTPSAAAKRYFHGTHRTCAPEETLARLQPLLTRMGITRIANVTGLDRTGIPVVMVCRPNARSMTVSQGKGLTLAAAKASGVMEAVEICHAEHIVKPLKFASFDEMRAEHRVADIEALPRARNSRYTAKLPLLWIEGEDLLGGGPMWVPFELVSANYTLPLPPGSGCFQANTNGLASGNHWLEAVSHGLCEVVERDARTLWKHLSPGAQAARVLDLNGVDDPACNSVIERFRSANLEVQIWDTNPSTAFRTGSLAGNVAGVSPIYKAGGRWNTYEIHAKGPEITVKLNGVVTVSAQDGRFPEGRLGIQFNGGPIKVRKMLVKEL